MAPRLSERRATSINVERAKMRKTLIEVVEATIQNNPSTALLLGDIGVYGFKKTLDQFPQRAFNLGILEQSMIGIAAGMASEGIIPIVHTIAPFLVERALEQIKVGFGYQQLPGNFISVGSSYDYSALGCTHHCPADINILSQVPGVNLFIPGTPKEFKHQFNTYWNNGEINYFRLSEQTHSWDLKNDLGELQRIKHGNTCTIIAVGPILDDVLKAIEGLDIELYYCSSISSKAKLEIDLEVLSNKLIIVEPYYSGAVLRKLKVNSLVNNFRSFEFGVPVEFIRKYGTFNQIKEFLQLDPESLRNRIIEVLG